MQIDDLIIKVQGMYLERHLSGRLRRLFSEFPVVVVTGARQVGKTTFLQQEFPELRYVVFDPVQDIAGARADPDLFLGNHPCPIILDEIQYAPELVPAIKRHVDERGGVPGQFVLTGSQQWHVLRNASESLAGRAVFLEMEGFSQAERVGSAGSSSWLNGWLDDPDKWLRQTHQRLDSDRSLLETLWRGTLPRACLVSEDVVSDFWDGYIRTYIERDARLLADLSDWQQFGMFIRLLCSLTACETNYSQLGRDIGITPQTAKRWLRVLQGTYQCFELPAFTGNMIKRVSSKPKGYMADTGLVCRSLQLSTPETLSGHAVFGPVFETFVAGEIRKQLALTGKGVAVYHWRSVGGAEVDILIERDGVYHPIEIKGASNPRVRDASGIHAFAKAYPSLKIAKGLVVAPVREVRALTERAVLAPWDLQD